MELTVVCCRSWGTNLCNMRQGDGSWPDPAASSAPPSNGEVECEDEADDDEHADGSSEQTPLLEEEESHETPQGWWHGFREVGSRGSMQRNIRKKACTMLEKAKVYGLVPRTLWESAFEELYGQLPTSELLPVIAWLSSMLFMIIGGFWLLDSLKDTVFAHLVGIGYQPWAKFASVLFTLVLTIAYNSLVDWVKKPTLFYVVGSVYTVAFLAIAALLAGEQQGLEHVEASPTRLLGWATYLAIESYGSLAVAMFWAFTNSTIDLEEAKSLYGLILAGAQVGAIVGSTLATRARDLGVPFLFTLGGFTPAIMALLTFGYTLRFGHMVPPETPRERRPQGGVWERMGEGLRVVYRYNYVLALAGISSLYEIVLTILDYEMKVIALAKLSRHPHASESFAELMGRFGQLTNALAFFFSLFGTSYIVRKLGLPTSLRLFPSLLIVASIAAYVYPYLGVLFFFVSILKALSYALNEPCKEMLYIPTSDLIRFKAKSWIDVFGSRTAKAFGSFVTSLAADNPDALVQIGSLPSWIVSFILLFISIYMGRSFARLQATGHVIGEPYGRDTVELVGTPRRYNRHRQRLSRSQSEGPLMHPPDSPCSARSCPATYNHTDDEPLDPFAAAAYNDPLAPRTPRSRPHLPPERFDEAPHGEDLGSSVVSV